MKTLLYRLFQVTLLAVLPFAAMAGNSAGTPFRAADPGFVILDSVPKKPVAKPEAKPSDKPEAKPSDKPVIKEVPKSRRQIKPAAVGERIKGKPPIKVKPNINIKKPVGNIKNIKRGLGKIG